MKKSIDFALDVYAGLAAEAKLADEIMNGIDAEFGEVSKRDAVALADRQRAHCLDDPTVLLGSRQFLGWRFGGRGTDPVVVG